MKIKKIQVAKWVILKKGEKVKKTSVYFRGCLLYTLAQWSTVFLTVRMFYCHLATADRPRLTIIDRIRDIRFYNIEAHF